MKQFCLCLIMLLTVNSCITRQVQKKPSYKETFYGYFASKYGNDLVFIGKKFHYIFKDNSNQISEFTRPEWKSKLSISDIKLEVDNDNNVDGYVELRLLNLSNNFTANERLKLNKMGFLENKKNILINKILLKGIRYEPTKDFDLRSGNSFSKRYESRIFYKVGTLHKVKKATLTPISALADGILIIAGGTFLPMAIIIATDENTPEKIMDRIKYKE